MTNIPLFSFFYRYWLLVLLTVVMNLACLNDWLFSHLGSLLYIPAISTLVAMVVYLLRHFIFRETIDWEASKGQFTREWRELDPRTRVILTVVITCTFFLGISIIAAGVSK